MRMPNEPKSFLGLALVVGILSLGIGGLIAAIHGDGPTDQMITAITGLLSAMVGGLIGHEVGKSERRGDDRDDT